MQLKLIRDKGTDACTLSKLYNGSQFLCYAIEDVVRDEKIYGKTAIPAGIYHIIITMSTRFKRLLPLLLDVPNYSGVRIHPGNTAADTDGCILPGLLRTDSAVYQSVKAMEMLQPLIQAALDKGEDVTIEIKNAM